MAHGRKLQTIACLEIGQQSDRSDFFQQQAATDSDKLGTSALPSGTLQLDYKYGVIVSGTLDETKNNGNLESQSISASGQTIKQSYTYDAVNRLLSASEKVNAESSARWTQSYSYDQWGNRTGLTNTGTEAGLLPTQSTPGVSGVTNRVTTSQYDTSGNQTQNAAGQTFGYDAENRQVSFNGSAATYSYDGDGRRVKKVDGTGTTVFVYNAGGQLIAEYTSGAATGSGTSYLTSDHLGSTRVVTKADGSVKARYDYLPYGEEIPASIGGRSGVNGYGGTDTTRQKFTQKERDEETKLDYFGARYYSSAQGRFASVDPENAGASPDDPQSWNGYAYARTNPLLFTDPDGQKYVVCGPDGSCGEILDDDFYAERKKFEALGFTFTGNKDFFEGGNIISPEGQVVASYQQIEIDLTGPNGRARMLAYEMRENFDDPRTYVRAAFGAALGRALRGRREQPFGAKQIGRAGDPGGKGLSRIDRFKELLRTGFTVGGQKYTINPHVINSLKKSGRRNIDPESMIRALDNAPVPVTGNSSLFVDPKTGTKFFVNTFTNEVVGVQPSTFK